ncbi:MAG: aldehyde dehydrogenase family protein, partial [Tepidisphaeraceae bacterium]
MDAIADILAGTTPVARQFIDGRWEDADGARTFAVHNPATGKLLGAVPASGALETRRAIEAAGRAFGTWSQTPSKQRAALLHEAARLMRQRQENLARLIAMEEGKPIAESRGEVIYAADFLSFFAEESQRCG